MILEYVSKLDLKLCRTNVRVQKIDSSTFETIEIVLAGFQVKDTLKRARFFYKMFLLVDVNIEIVLEMPFLTFSNADMKFA